jgi:redox-sensitive bicupin YhaK (pirin superfamily)
MTTRKVKLVLTAKPTLEGAGVHLHRVFGWNEVPLFDPFLLLDDFRSDEPKHFLKGFPWHPHRGIETITYVTKGDVEHADSLGNKGVIGTGDVQWMTAGSGIIHQEMPQGDQEGRMHGFQLWANLPKTHKMMDPRYRGIVAKDIPITTLENGIEVKVIAGSVNQVQGPVTDIITEPSYLDVSIPPGSEFRHKTSPGHTVFAYATDGSGAFGTDEKSGQEISAVNRQLLLYADGEEINIRTSDQSVRFLLISGKPIGEPVAWYGPIVMNTDDELRIAFDEYNNGTFIKYKTSS